MSGNKSWFKLLLLAFCLFAGIEAAKAAPTEVQRFYGHSTGGISKVGFFSDGLRCFSYGYDKIIRVWTCATGSELSHIAPESGLDLINLEVNSAGQLKAILYAEHSHSLTILDVETGVVSGPYFARNLSDIKSAAISADQRILYAASQRLLVTWSIDAPHETREMAMGTYVRKFRLFDQDSKVLVQADSESGIHSWNLSPIWENWGQTLEGDWGITDTLLASGNSKFVTFEQTFSDNVPRRRLRVWDTASGALVNATTLPTNHQGSMQVSPDGQNVIYAVGYQGVNTIAMLDIETLAEQWRLTNLTAFPLEIAFSPDGRFVLFAADTAARLWRIRD